MDRLLIDLDGTIVDLWAEADSRALLDHAPCRWNVEGCCTSYTMDFIFGSDDIFNQAKPIPGAIDGVKQLMRTFDVHFVSTPWPTAHDSAKQKYEWVQRYFHLPQLLTLTHHKNLIPAFAIIDDRPGLQGPWLHIEYPQAWNTQTFPTWEEGLADHVESARDTLHPRRG